MSTGTIVELTWTDVRILQYLRDAGADYPALIASNTGQHLAHVERRIDVLVDEDLVEPISEEVVVRITSDGADALSDADRARRSDSDHS